MHDFVLEQALPLPMRGHTRPSDVWNTRCTLQSGGRHLVVAPSGTGKSSLLGILFGIRQDYDGSVSLGGQKLRGFTEKDWVQLRQRRVSYLFQGLQLFPELTALENIRLKNQLTNHLPESKIVEMLAAVGLEAQTHQLARSLSFGQAQRVALVRALSQPFEWLFLDEPFSHLDEANVQLLLPIINEALQTQQAGLLITSLAPDKYFDYDAVLHL